MKLLRVLLLLTFCLLSGCLVVFREPLPSNEPPPLALLGEWARTNEWGEQMFLQISRADENTFKARLMAGSPDNLDGAEEYTFTVNRSGPRWYLTAHLPKRFGNNFGVGGFEISSSNELILYSLDDELFVSEVESGRLAGQVIEIAGEKSALVTASTAQVLAFLNDPANSDAFVEASRFQHSNQ